MRLNTTASCRRSGWQPSLITRHWGRERIAAAPRVKSPAPDVHPGLAGRFKSVRRRVGEPTPGHNRASGIGPGGFGTCRRVCPGCSTSGRSNFRPRMAGRIEGVGRCVGNPTAGCDRRGGVRRATLYRRMCRPHEGSRRSLVCMLVFHRKKLGPIMLIEHVCACVYDVGSVVSCYSGRALHAGMRGVVWRSIFNLLHTPL